VAIAPEEREHRRALEHAKLRRMIAYADTAGCLRATILRYFGNPAAREPRGACGTCDRREPIGEADRLFLRKILWHRAMLVGRKGYPPSSRGCPPPACSTNARRG
jgi:superfamily II DNA helicase RecQ